MIGTNEAGRNEAGHDEAGHDEAGHGEAWYDEDAGPLVRRYATVEEDLAGEHGTLALFVGSMHDAGLTDACRPRPGGEATYPVLQRLLTGLRAL